MVWLVTHMWIALAVAALFGLLFGSSLRAMMLRGKTRTAIVERDVARTELGQAHTEIEALYAAQRKTAEGEPPETSNEALQAELAARDRQIADLNTALTAAKAEPSKAADEPVPAAVDDTLKAELTARESRISELSAQLASARSEIDAAKAAIEEAKAKTAQAAPTAVAAVAGAAAGALATQAVKPLDADVDDEKAELVMRNRFLESRVRSLETQVSEMAEAEPAQAAGAEPAAVPPAVEAPTGPDPDLAKIKWQNEYLRQRLTVLEETAVSAARAKEAAEPAPVQPAPEPEVADETVDEELAKLRWRNRYLESRVAYYEGDADVKPEDAGDAPEAAEAKPNSAPAPEPAKPAAPPAPPETPEQLKSPRGAADNLTDIDGIGPKIQEVLNSLGIYHLDQIAGWTPGNASWVEQQMGFEGRISRERWIEQAAGALEKA